MFEGFFCSDWDYTPEEEFVPFACLMFFRMISWTWSGELIFIHEASIIPVPAVAN